MPTKSVRDLCGLCCVAEFSNYENAEFFVYLIGTGATRSRYELTAQDRSTGGLLFDIQVEASAPALQARAAAAGSYQDAQAVAVALDYARRIVDAKAYEQEKRYRLIVDVASESLLPAAAVQG